MPRTLPEPVKGAVDRLLEVASRDTGQSRRCADFLLSWWNAEKCGGWDPVDLWGLDLSLRRDVLQVVAYLASADPYYPDNLGYGPQFDRLVRERRPHLFDRATR